MQDDDGPLCHFEVDENGELRQRVDPALSYAPSTRAVALGFDYAGAVAAAWTSESGDVVVAHLPLEDRLGAAARELHESLPSTSPWCDDDWIFELYQRRYEQYCEAASAWASRFSWIENVAEWTEVFAPTSGLTDWQRDLARRAYGRGRCIETSTNPGGYVWPGERTEWERQLDDVRADHDEQQRRRLWSERDLDFTARGCPA